MSQPAREQSTRLQSLRTDLAHPQVLPKLAAPTLLVHCIHRPSTKAVKVEDFRRPRTRCHRYLGATWDLDHMSRLLLILRKGNRSNRYVSLSSLSGRQQGYLATSPTSLMF
jgi:hypothetical protein